MEKLMPASEMLKLSKKTLNDIKFLKKIELDKQIEHLNKSIQEAAKRGKFQFTANLYQYSLNDEVKNILRMNGYQVLINQDSFTISWG